MNWAHRFVDASFSSAISCLSSVAAIPMLGQPLSALQMTGGLIGLAAVAVVAALSRQPDSPLPETRSSPR